MPATVFHAYTCLGADRFECHLDLGRMAGSQAGVAPSDHQPLPRRVGAHGADLEAFAVGEAFDQPTAFAIGAEGPRRPACRGGAG